MAKDIPQPREPGLNERIPRNQLNKLTDRYMTTLAVRFENPLRSVADLLQQPTVDPISTNGELRFPDDNSDQNTVALYESFQLARRLTADTVTVTSRGKITVSEIEPKSKEDTRIVDWVEFTYEQTYDSTGNAIESLGSIAFGEAGGNLPVNLPRPVNTYGDNERLLGLKSARFFAD